MHRNLGRTVYECLEANSESAPLAFPHLGSVVGLLNERIDRPRCSGSVSVSSHDRAMYCSTPAGHLDCKYVVPSTPGKVLKKGGHDLILRAFQVHTVARGNHHAERSRHRRVGLPEPLTFLTAPRGCFGAEAFYDILSASGPKSPLHAPISPPARQNAPFSALSAPKTAHF